MDINKEFEKLVEEFEKEWHDGHEPQGIDDQYVEEDEEAEIAEKKAATGYDLYHKDFSSAMQHAYAHAKKKGHVVDPKEIDDKVATGPKKPSSGKTNRYALKAGRKTVHIQVANLDNKRYELNMYIEDYDKNQLLRVKHDEALIAEAGDICGLDRGDLRSKSMQNVYDKKCAPEHKDKKSIFGKINKGLEIYNQNSIGEQKMEKSLVDTVRSVLMGEEEELSDKQKAYRKFFDKALKKFKIKSPADLKDDEAKKKFYDYIDKGWEGEHEEVETKKKVAESAALQLKMAFDDAKIKIKGTKGGKLVIDKKDKKKVEKVISKQMKKPADAKRVLGSQIVFEDSEDQVDPNPSKTMSKLFSHVRKLMSK